MGKIDMTFMTVIRYRLCPESDRSGAVGRTNSGDGGRPDKLEAIISLLFGSFTLVSIHYLWVFMKQLYLVRIGKFVYFSFYWWSSLEKHGRFLILQCILLRLAIETYDILFSLDLKLQMKIVKSSPKTDNRYLVLI